MMNFSVFEYIVFVLTSYSLTFGWIESPLFDFLRKKLVVGESKISYLCHCYHCAGFWISLIMSFIIFSTTITYHVILALSSCIIIFILDRLVTLADRIICMYSIQKQTRKKRI